MKFGRLIAELRGQVIGALFGALIASLCGVVAIWPLRDAGSAGRTKEGLLAASAAGGLLLVLGIVLGGWRFARWTYALIRLGSWSGISRVYPVQGYPGTTGGARAQSQFDDALEGLRDAVSEEKEVDLLLASGFKHFGAGKFSGWIERAIFEREGVLPKLRVLLLAPGTDVSKTRANQWKMTEETYAAGIGAVLWKLRGWKRERGLSIEVRLYSEAPIWQMVLTSKEVWLLCARQVPVDQSPVYCLRRKTPYTLAYGLEAVWERRWEGAEPLDLDQVKEPDFGTLVEHA